VSRNSSVTAASSTLIQDFLEHAAVARPAKTAVITGVERLSYADIDAMANRLANAFLERGVQRGDRVAIFLNNSVQMVVSIFAALKANAVFVGINRASRPEKVLQILNNCQAAALVADARAIAQGFGEKVSSEAPSVKSVVVCTPKGGTTSANKLTVQHFADIQETFPGSRPERKNIEVDLGCLIYTSGTTGEPKGVMCDHGNVVFVTESIVSYLKNTEQDIVLNVLPLSSSYGLYQLMAAFRVGATLVLEEGFGFPDLIVERMAKERVTGFAGVPTVYAMLLGLDVSGYDLSALRYITNAGSGLPVEHIKRLRQHFPKTDLYLMHGLTEVARTMYLPPEQADVRPGSSGIPIPGTELWVEDETGRRLTPGEVGELVVRGPHVMRGYWNSPELTNFRFRPGPVAGERVCFTGDLFKTDAEGYFYFVSRKDDIIKSRGEKVAPREVENVLCTLPGVVEAAVVGVPDAVLGQAIKAVIVLNGTKLTEADVIAHCKARLEYFMVPRQVEFRQELPKTPSGKIKKLELS